MRPPRPVLERAIGLYSRAYRVDLSECVVPNDGFRSFNEFFARPLREGARPLDDDPLAVLCPADGRLEDEGPIGPDASLLVKGQRYEVGELLGDDSERARFDGGRFAIVYLSPRDYHRVHAPVSGRVVRTRHIGGTLFPVNRIGLDHVPGLFAKNERIVVHLESEHHGELVVILVGAMIVGSIQLAFDAHPERPDPHGSIERHPTDVSIERGAELGRFLLGSTAIVLTRPEPALELVLPARSVTRVGRALYRTRA